MTAFLTIGAQLHPAMSFYLMLKGSTQCRKRDADPQFPYWARLTASDERISAVDDDVPSSEYNRTTKSYYSYSGE